MSPTGSFLVRLLIYFLKSRTRGIVEIQASHFFFFSSRATQIREMINLSFFKKKTHVFLAKKSIFVERYCHLLL